MQSYADDAWHTMVDVTGKQTFAVRQKKEAGQCNCGPQPNSCPPGPPGPPGAPGDNGEVGLRKDKYIDAASFTKPYGPSELIDQFCARKALE